MKKPTIDEVQQYCDERQNGINAAHFIDYYDSCGWTVGRKPMKDWKAAVRTWENRRKQDKGVKKPALIDQLRDRTWAG